MELKLYSIKIYIIYNLKNLKYALETTLYT